MYALSGWDFWRLIWLVVLLCLQSEPGSSAKRWYLSYTRTTQISVLRLCWGLRDSDQKSRRLVSLQCVQNLGTF